MDIAIASFGPGRTCIFPGGAEASSTLEALVYEMPLGMVFRRVVLWHKGREHAFHQITEFERDPQRLIWSFCCPNPKFMAIQVQVRGRDGFIRRLPYFKTDCSGQLDVANDSLATARMTWYGLGGRTEEMSTDTGAVVEMAGDYT